MPLLRIHESPLALTYISTSLTVSVYVDFVPPQHLQQKDKVLLSTDENRFDLGDGVTEIRPVDDYEQQLSISRNILGRSAVVCCVCMLILVSLAMFLLVSFVH
jgi:hypothetical protein